MEASAPPTPDSFKRKRQLAREHRQSQRGRRPEQGFRAFFGDIGKEYSAIF